MRKTDTQTRQRILQAALKRFAECGYAGASIQEMADDARVTKPMLYYYFESKAGLYRALIDRAQDERFRLAREAAARGGTLAEQLTEIVAAMFDFVRRNRELTRLAFAASFAARGEVPESAHCREQGRRILDFIHELIRAAWRRNRLNRRFGSEELALGIYGMLSMNVMLHLVMPERTLNRRLAERIVRLFLAGAAARNGK